MSSIIKRIPINFEARTIKPLNIVIVWHPKWSRPRRSSLIRNVSNGNFFFEGSSIYPYKALFGTFTISDTEILLLTKHQHSRDDRPLSFLKQQIGAAAAPFQLPRVLHCIERGFDSRDPWQGPCSVSEELFGSWLLIQYLSNSTNIHKYWDDNAVYLWVDAAVSLCYGEQCWSQYKKQLRAILIRKLLLRTFVTRVISHGLRFHLECFWVWITKWWL